jgi:two-component system LytT family response regulator
MSPVILVVDDEEMARRGIVELLRRHPRGGSWQVAEAANGVEALRLIPELAPQVVFLDVEMPQLSGFDVLMQLPARPFQVVFQTAHADFALKAFDADACDYLLKPFSDERFYLALDKALARAATPGAEGAVDRLLVKTEIYLERLAFKLGARHKIVDAADVLYFFSEQHATTAHLEGASHVTDHSLDHLESRLDPARFVRIHRNAIVNLRAVRMVQTGQAMTVTMQDGRVLTVSKERRAKVRPLLLAERG